LNTVILLFGIVLGVLLQILNSKKQKANKNT